MLRKITLSIISGFLLALPFLNERFWILAWIGFLPLFFALKNISKRKAFLLSYITGIIFWGVTIYWLIHVTLPGLIVLVLYLALYFTLFGLVIPTARPFFIPCIWVILEYIRGHLFTGFPWALLGYSQYLNLAIIQISDITGAYGVSFLIMMANVFIYRLINNRAEARNKRIVLVFFVLIFSLGYGFYKLNLHPSPADIKTVRIAVVQANVPQSLKWDTDYVEFIMNKYISLATQVAKEKPDLIIWPEAALPVILEEDPQYFERVKSLAKEINTPLLLGAVTFNNRQYFNSAILLSGEGLELERYSKLHLVPFGEYIPLKKSLPFLETIVPIGDISPGKTYKVFEKWKKQFSVLICFEDLFPELSREFVRRKADFLVNITNDAWYKKTQAATQHLQASIFRAVENRVFLARCANTGISGFIEPSGRITSLIKDASGKNIFVEGVKTQELSIYRGKETFYTKYGDIFILACFLNVIYVIIARLRRHDL